MLVVVNPQRLFVEVRRERDVVVRMWRQRAWPGWLLRGAECACWRSKMNAWRDRSNETVGERGEAKREDYRKQHLIH